MSDLTLATALPADVLATVQGRPADAADSGTLDALRPAGRAGTAPRPEAGSDPFAALLQGFWASTQPLPPADTAPATAGAEAQAAVADAVLPTPGLPTGATGPVPAAAAPPPEAMRSPAAGNILPPTGSGLPAASPEPAGVAGDANGDTRMPAPATVPGVPERISLADLEAGRQLRGMPGGMNADDPLANLPTLASDGEAPALPDDSADAAPRPAAADQPYPAMRTHPVPPPDFARMVVELGAAPARDLASTNQRTPEWGLAGGNPPAALVTPAAGGDGLRAAVGSALQGFPALQPLGDAKAWTEGLGDRLLTLAGPGAHSAKLKLHPEHLGALDVEISIDDGSAQVWFGTAHQQAREAIESSLPRLREMFADQGLTLVRAQVDSGAERGTPFGAASQPHPEPAANASGWSRPLEPSLPPAVASGSRGSRLLDVWA